MSLEGLLKIDQIKPHLAERDEIQKLLDAAARNLQDAVSGGISVETRFDCAYKAIMQSALVALMANGYRPNTNKPGHHMTIIQALPLTMGLPVDRMVLLDALRRKRNINDYSGEYLDEETAAACAREARRLLAEIQAWLRAHHPALG